MILLPPKDGDRLAQLSSAAAAKTFFSVDRVGLPERTWVTRYAQKLMGDLAAASVVDYLRKTTPLVVEDYDSLREDRFMLRDPGWDLAITDVASEIQSGMSGWSQPPTVCTISVKSSQLPVADPHYSDAIARRDFKVFSYNNSIINDLHADIECQVYLPHPIPRYPDISRKDIEIAREDLVHAKALVQKLDPLVRWHEMFLVGFCTAPMMVRYSNSRPLDKRQFKMPGFNKRFWSLPLSKLATSPDRIVEMVNWILIRGHTAPVPIDPQDADWQSPT